MHLNFPDLVTTETRARRARKAVINRCRRELGGRPPLRFLKEEINAAEALAKAEADLAAMVVEEARLLAMAEAARGGGGAAAGAGGELDSSSGSAAAAAAADSESAVAATEAGSGQASTVAAAAAAAEAAAEEAVDAGDLPPPLFPELLDLDWEAVVDLPHGSLRLPGCYKAPWMDKDPDWVEDKCYSVVEW